MRSVLKKWTNAIRQSVLNRLERSHPAYEQRIYNNMERLYGIIRKGDVVLVEGRSEMSRIIKLFSSSHWSHVAMYVGDSLIAPEDSHSRDYQTRFGSEARHLVVEAFSGQGVIVSPLSKYRDFNIRICRPYGIQEDDLHTVVSDVIGNIGLKYDNQNILDIGLMVLGSSFRSVRRRSLKACLGSCKDFQVICSGMIARAFQKAGYPIVPALASSTQSLPASSSNPYGAGLIMRHFSQILPRDFDLSPNFEVIKFNIVGLPFNYQTLWHEKIDH